MTKYASKKSTPWLTATTYLIVGVATLLISPLAARAGVGAERPAAIVVFPAVEFIDGIRDTIIELANTSDEPLTVQCFYLNGAGTCSGEGGACLSDDNCATQCEFGYPVSDFVLRLTGRQVIGWRAGSGLQQLPLPENRGGVIPVPTSEFFGELKCIAMSSDDFDHLRPAPRNHLIGSATFVEPTAEDRLDAQSYTAIGFESTGFNDGDPFLCLGASADSTCPQAEYEACPLELRVTHFMQNSTVAGFPTNSRFLLVPCSENLDGTASEPTTVEFQVVDEFELIASYSTTITGYGRFVPNDLVFDAAARGSVAAQTIIRVVGGAAKGLIGVGWESHTGDPTGRAFFALGSRALATDADVIRMRPPL